MIMINKHAFSPSSHFQPVENYHLLPFRFDEFQDNFLLVNEVGEHLTIGNNDFQRFIAGELAPMETVYEDLKGRHFLYDDDLSVPLRLLATKFRSKKAHLQDFTKLHIFVVTLRCEHSCKYCQVSRVSEDRLSFDMSPEIAKASLEMAFHSPSPMIKIEFQGGEPLLAFDLICELVEGATERAAQLNKTVEFVITTNLALITTEILEYCRDNSISLSTSLDGPASLHNANRGRRNNDSYERTIAGLELARSIIGPDSVSAIMTTTRQSLDHPEEIINEYIDHGFHSIFLRNLSPYGFAVRTAQSIGYSMDAFLQFYVRAFDHILNLNREGIRFVETYAQILLTRMLTPFSTGYVDLQSPAGAGTSVAVYNYDGGVYPSDEARMLAAAGDQKFCMGNVLKNSYSEIFHGRIIRDLIERTNLESTPICSDCAFQPWCGADPIFHYGTQGDIEPDIPTSDFHKKHDFLFRHLLKLNSDPINAQIFQDWIAT